MTGKFNRKVFAFRFPQNELPEAPRMFTRQAHRPPGALVWIGIGGTELGDCPSL